MNRSADYQFTIIIPVYNEEDNILELENVLRQFIPTSRYKACALFVNDGSKDNSLNLIQEVCKRNPDFFYLSLRQNGGLSNAMKAGIDATYSPYLGYMDADLQTTPLDFNSLLEHIEAYEMVLGIRANRKDSWVKNLSSKIANSFRRFMTKDGVVDTGCPLKVLHTQYAKRIPFFTGMHRFLPALIQLQNGRVMQIPVHHFPRMAGVSKYNLRNRLVSPFLDCFAYRWMKKRYLNYEVTDQNI